MVICAIICTIQASQFPGTAVYARMLVSIIATYACYVVSSVLWMDPFHLITSFIQYVLLSATYVTRFYVTFPN